MGGNHAFRARPRKIAAGAPAVDVRLNARAEDEGGEGFNRPSQFLRHLPNLALSFQAAYAAPFIMMSQNRQAAIDRAAAMNDDATNAEAELEIELLPQKLDMLRETEVSELIRVIRRLESRLPAQPEPTPNA